MYVCGFHMTTVTDEHYFHSLVYDVAYIFSCVFYLFIFTIVVIVIFYLSRRHGVAGYEQFWIYVVQIPFERLAF